MPPESDPRARGEVESASAEAAEAERAIDEPADGDVAKLRAAGDVDALLALARDSRVRRDMRGCLAAYEAAAELGSAEAMFAAALFHMSGGPVAQDWKEGTTRLRSAAEKGSVGAKIYLGNLYELGIHYRVDAEKADVWYRNAARGARVDEAPESPEYARALAELGSARHVRALVGTGALTPEEETRFTQRARIHGQGLRPATEAGDRPTLTGGPSGDRAAAGRQSASVSDAPADAPANPDLAGRPAKIDPAAANAALETKADEAFRAREARARSRRTRAALTSFGYAMLFVLTGAGAGWAGSAGVAVAIAHGTLRGSALAFLEERAAFVFPAIFLVIGILPCLLVYRARAVGQASVVGAIFAASGWALSERIHALVGSSQAAEARELHALVLGAAGYLAALLVGGLLGGARRGASGR